MSNSTSYVQLCDGYPTVVPLYLWGIGSRTPSDTKTYGCSSPLYKMAQHNRPSVSVGSASMDTESQLYTLCKPVKIIILPGANFQLEEPASLCQRKTYSYNIFQFKSSAFAFRYKCEVLLEMKVINYFQVKMKNLKVLFYAVNLDFSIILLHID